MRRRIIFRQTRSNPGGMEGSICRGGVGSVNSEWEVASTGRRPVGAGGSNLPLGGAR